MNPIHLSLAGQNPGSIPTWAVLLICAALILWLWSVVVIAKEKTEDPYDRIVWLLIVLMLNFIGTLLYFFFGGDEKSKERSENQKMQSERNLKRRANDGTL